MRVIYYFDLHPCFIVVMIANDDSAITSTRGCRIETIAFVNLIEVDEDFANAHGLTAAQFAHLNFAVPRS